MLKIKCRSIVFFLGKFTDSKDKNYDLGVHIFDTVKISAAVVYENVNSNYKSGLLRDFKGKVIGYTNSPFEYYIETIKRCKKVNLL
jgi:hypothetical protein